MPSRRPIFLFGAFLSLLLSGCGAPSRNSSVYYPPSAPDPIPSSSDTSGGEEPRVFPELPFSACPEGSVLEIVALETYYQYGDAVFVSYKESESAPSSFDILIDGGNMGYGGYEGTARALGEFLSQNVEDGVLDLLVLSHEHGDHYGGFENGTLQNSGINSVSLIVDNGVSGYGYSYSLVWEEGVRDYWTKRGSEYHPVTELLETAPCVKMGEGAYVGFLDTGYYPAVGSSGNEENPNLDSIAMFVRAGDTAFYTAGDLADAEAEASVMELNSLEDRSAWFLKGAETTVYKASHHGSRTYGGNSAEFLAWIKPDYGFASSAITPENQEGSRYYTQHPYDQAMDRIAARIAAENNLPVSGGRKRVYFNGTAGNFHFRFAKGEEEPLLYGEGRRACDYYDMDGNPVDPSEEKDLCYYDTAFYKKAHL